MAETGGAGGSGLAGAAGSNAGDGASAGGSGTNDAGTADCNAAAVDVRAVADGTLQLGSNVVLEGVVATSQKFLIVRTSSASCLWGVFVADPASEAAAYQGLLIVSYGAPAKRQGSELADCRAGTDAIPDAVAIGDVLSVAGRVEVFEPGNCPEAARPRQVRVRAQLCPIVTLGSGAPPVPALLDVTTADEIARGEEAGAAWASVLVRLRDVSGVRDGTNLDVVGPYGTIRFDETALPARDKVFYWDLADGGPGDPNKAASFGFPTSFECIDGLAFLDRCDWVLAPRDRCRDFTPASAGCE